IDATSAYPIAWLPSSKALLTWTGNTAQQTVLRAVGGVVVAVSRMGPDAVLLVSEGGALSEVAVELDGGLLGQPAAVEIATGPKVWRHATILAGTDPGSAPETKLVFERMGADKWHAFSPDGKRHWVVTFDKAGVTWHEIAAHAKAESR